MYYVSAPLVTDGLALIYDGINPLCLTRGSAVVRTLGPNSASGSISTAFYTNERGGGLFVSSSTLINLSRAYSFSYPVTIQTVINQRIDNDGNGRQIFGEIAGFSRFRVGSSAVSQGGGLVLAGRSGSSLETVLFETGALAPTGSDYVLTVTGTSNQVWTTYVNGRQALPARTTNLSSAFVFNFDRLCLPFGGATFPFVGNIYHISIYNRALSESEILQNYNTLKTRFNLL
ncbi:hypothetical protein UFOVP449_96 [uncultured Caudovirales phage]|uniref:Concanavalin A-like lectin/glucanases superfamily n=1 Tax=uncultured Caudovirales phage TaxID=2100421 RepID=A0A6J5M8I1_9CAUD|nr:hypothetical protein UFOVP449_96 [uncultured Caudovirales phage]